MKRIALILFTLFWMVACSDDSDSSSNDNGDTGGHDTASESDALDDTDTSPETPYKAFNCAVNGLDPSLCENLLCLHEEFYIEKLMECNVLTETSEKAACLQFLNCYNKHVICMNEACPAGSALPQTTAEKSEAGIYTCNNTFDECTLQYQ